MNKLLLIVEDSFQISGRGVTVAPFAAPEILGTSQNGHQRQVLLARPDGTKEIVEAAFYWQHFNPGGFQFCFFLEQGSKEQVPRGTEIWLLETD